MCSKCACGHENEDAEHYLRECPRYAQLRTKYNLLQHNTNVLLYGSEESNVIENQMIFERVCNYILDTERF